LLTDFEAAQKKKTAPDRPCRSAELAHRMMRMAWPQCVRAFPWWQAWSVLPAEEGFSYVNHRLQVAGYDGRVVTPSLHVDRGAQCGYTADINNLVNAVRWVGNGVKNIEAK